MAVHTSCLAGTIRSKQQAGGRGQATSENQAASKSTKETNPRANSLWPRRYLRLTELRFWWSAIQQGRCSRVTEGAQRAKRNSEGLALCLTDGEGANMWASQGFETNSSRSIIVGKGKRSCCLVGGGGGGAKMTKMEFPTADQLQSGMLRMVLHDWFAACSTWTPRLECG